VSKVSSIAIIADKDDLVGRGEIVRGVSRDSFAVQCSAWRKFVADVVRIRSGSYNEMRPL